MLNTIKNVLANLSKRPTTRMYPMIKRRSFDKNRGHLVNDMKKCVLCGMCRRVCPSDCIKVDRQTKTWEYNPFECILCGVCVEKCPKHSLSLDKDYRKPNSGKYLVELIKQDQPIINSN